MALPALRADAGISIRPSTKLCITPDNPPPNGFFSHSSLAYQNADGKKNTRGPLEQINSHIFDTLYKVPLAKTIRHKT